MKNLLKHLSDEELLRFEKFINSPYFNTSRKPVELFRLLRNQENVNSDNHILFSSLYPGEKYNDTRFRKVLSDLKKLFERFLGYSGIDKLDPFSIDTNMLELMQEKGMQNDFSAAYRQFSRRLSAEYFKEDPYYRSLSRIELLQYYEGYNKLKNPSPKGLEKASLNMDLHFVYSKLNLIRDILLHNVMNKDKYKAELRFFDEILKFAEENKALISKEHPNLYIIYLTVMATLKGSDQQYIDELADYIKKNEKKFDKMRLNYYHTYLASYYWNRINAGSLNFRPKLFEVYKQMERKGIIKSERYIPHSAFNSIVIAAVWAKDFIWLEKFIEKHKTDIEPEYYHDVYNLSMAKLHFYSSKYESSLKHLNNVVYRTPNYYINAKTIMLKTLYELGDYDGIKFSLDSIKHYMYRNNILNSQQIHNLKMLIKYFKYLLKVRSRDNVELQKFIELLDREKSFVPERDWFNEKVSELAVIQNG
ncbi:MAG TPA: hypothetical protein PKE39_12995 [Ignavibacteria bacterium]|nr:hypothetical protein [Ignavibacteria bacterium]HMQ99936.1 hypothetical protein [Ignavibacteria bacterium]